MQISQCACDLRCVEFGPLFCEVSVPLKVVEQLASIDEVQHEEQLGRGLEGEVEGDQEGVFEVVHKDVPFAHQVSLLSVRPQFTFLQNLKYSYDYSWKCKKKWFLW